MTLFYYTVRTVTISTINHYEIINLLNLPIYDVIDCKKTIMLLDFNLAAIKNKERYALT